jgi:uncharacterized protein YbcI
MSTVTIPAELKSRGELEAEITQSVLRLLRDVLGRGPRDARTYLCDSLIVVRCSIPLQPQERTMIASDTVNGVEAVRSWRRNLIETCRTRLLSEVATITNVPIRAFFTDCCPVHEEAILSISLVNKPCFRVALISENISLNS